MSNTSVWRCAWKFALGLAVGAVASWGMPALGYAQVSEVEQLRRELAEYRKHIQALEKRLDEQEAKAVAKEKEPALEAGFDDGFYIRTKNRPFSMVFNGFSQFLYSLNKSEGGRVNQELALRLRASQFPEMFSGEVIFKEGDPPTSVMVVLAGNIQVFVEREGEDIILTDVHPGGVLGELAVLCGIPRSASLRASEQAVVLLWSVAAFRNLLLRYALLSERIFRESLRR